MIVTLSEERNEKLVFEWAEDMTEDHAQDFCDVCNVVFTDHYTVPYILERFGVNIYGGGYICVVYKDDKPLACLGGIRNDLNGKTTFQFEHFATVPQARKGGYVVEMLFCIFNEVGARYPDALFFCHPSNMAYPVYGAAGFAQTKMYQRIFHGPTKDFLQSMPYIEDKYAEAFTLKKKKAAILTIKGKCYAVLTFLGRNIIPAGLLLGEVNPKFKGTVPDVGLCRIYRYYSLKPGILGDRDSSNIVTYQLGVSDQSSNPIPPDYKSCHASSDFFGGRC